MSLTLRKIKNTSFPELYKRFLANDILSNKEIQNLLSIAIILINSDDFNVRRLGYRIIVIYSNRTKDYAPLYEISINSGLYPIAKFIDQKVLSDSQRSFFTELNTSFLETFKSNNIYFSEQQYLLNDFYSKKKDETVSVIAPTSYGKSELILNTIREQEGKNICIITPTKSLLAQTRYRVLNAKIPWVNKVVVHPEMYNNADPYCVAILTQERLFRLLKENPQLVFDSVIVDEAHELLEDTQREEMLATTIVVLNKRNPNITFKFLTPFITNERNLQVRYTTYDLTAYKISEYVKTERFYLYDIRNNAGLQLYDQYVNEWIHVPSEPENSTSIQFIQRHSAGKNIIYFNKPTDIEKFANEMLASLPDIALSPELSTAIEHISEYINSEYTIVKCLKKGIIYHHGSVPDTVRSYIEYLYNNFPEIKYVITSSTLLEGVNIPATKLFIMDNRKGVGNLSPSAFKNLIGRICRFGEIFDKDSGSLSYLEPEIYFVFDKFYAKNSNVKKYVSDVMKADKDINDQVDNVLLKNSVITEENTNELIRAEEFIENYEPETIQNYQQRYAATNIGKICILNNVTEIDVFDCEAGLDKKVSEYAQNVLLNGKISDSGTLLDAICDIFLPYTRENEENNNFLRFRNISAKNYYKMFLSWKLQSLPFNQMISHTITYWRRIISQNGNPIVYVGKWGTQTRDGGHRNLWTDIREKDKAQLINLAIVRVKEEQDFIDNTIMKFVEVLHDLELIEQNLYLTLKYGTANAVEIVLIKNGVSLSLTQLLIEKYSDSISVNLLTDTVLFSKELVNKMKQNDENQILIYEAMTNTF